MTYNERVQIIANKMAQDQLKRILGMNNPSRDEILFEMPDNATAEQIQEEVDKLAFEWACNYLDCWAETPELEAGKDETK